MEKILLNSFSGDKVEANIIRYFEAESKKYLVYTLNEKDADNYLRLYVGRVANNNGRLEINIISDENEWASVKGLFKSIIAANREARPVPVKDLNVSELGSATLNSYRVFKLLSDMAVILGENINEGTSGEQKTVEQPSTGFAFDNLEPLTPQAPAYQAPVEPVAPTYDTPSMESYEMPTPTPNVMEFNPEPTPAPVPSEPAVEVGNDVTSSQEVEELQDKIDELMLENAELKSKIETIKLLLK